jgi:DHA1 family bicyclomycin/chloramphenicol resistance-like MFS transporter
MNFKELTYLMVIISIFISSVIETDIYLPALPDMMYYFSQSEETIQKLLIWNFIGFCASGLIYGPISDSFGRKKPLMIALGMFFIGSFITLIANNFEFMLIGRLLQGLGSGGCFTLGTAIIFDIFQEKKAIQALNKINIIVPLIMASAPLLGGYLNQKFGFRSNFLAIFICVSVSFSTCALFLKETLIQNKRIKFNLRTTLINFRRVITCLPFIKLTLIISLLFAGFLVFLSSSSLLFVIQFGITKSIYPIFHTSLLLAYLIASLSCDRFITKIGINKVKNLGLYSVVLGGVSLLFVSFFFPKNALLITIVMLPYAFGFVWTQTPYVTEVMELIPDIKGISASILTSFRLLITASALGLSSFLYNATIYPVAYLILFFVLLITILIFSYEGYFKSVNIISLIRSKEKFRN